jgi:hypothetical protein
VARTVLASSYGHQRKEVGGMAAFDTLIWVSLGVVLLAYLAYVVAGATESVVWAVSVALLSPFSALVFTFVHWRRARIPFLIAMVGGLSSVVALTGNLATHEPEIVVGNRGRARVTLPLGWSVQSNLNADAEIQVGNLIGGRFLIMITDTKESLSKANLGNLELYDLAELLAADFAETFRDGVVRGPEGRMVGPLPAVEHRIIGSVENYQFTAIHVTLEGSTSIYRLIAWSPTSQFPSSESELRQVIDSFEEIGATPEIVAVNGPVRFR